MWPFKPKPQKINVEIIHKNKKRTRKKCPIESNTVIIEEGKRGRGHAGWTPTFNGDSIVQEDKGFGFLKRTKQTLMIIEGAEECISFDTDKEKAELPTWDKPAAKKFISSGAATNLGNVRIRHELPLVFWLLVALIGGNILLQLLAMRGVRLV